MTDCKHRYRRARLFLRVVACAAVLVAFVDAVFEVLGVPKPVVRAVLDRTVPANATADVATMRLGLVRGLSVRGLRLSDPATRLRVTADRVSFSVARLPLLIGRIRLTECAADGVAVSIMPGTTRLATRSGRRRDPGDRGASGANAPGTDMPFSAERAQRLEQPRSLSGRLLIRDLRLRTSLRGGFARVDHLSAWVCGAVVDLEGRFPLERGRRGRGSRGAQVPGSAPEGVSASLARVVDWLSSHPIDMPGGQVRARFGVTPVGEPRLTWRGTLAIPEIRLDAESLPGIAAEAEWSGTRAHVRSLSVGSGRSALARGSGTLAPPGVPGTGSISGTLHPSNLLQLLSPAARRYGETRLSTDPWTFTLSNASDGSGHWPSVALDVSAGLRAEDDPVPLHIRCTLKNGGNGLVLGATYSVGDGSAEGGAQVRFGTEQSRLTGTADIQGDLTGVIRVAAAGHLPPGLSPEACRGKLSVDVQVPLKPATGWTATGQCRIADLRAPHLQADSLDCDVVVTPSDVQIRDLTLGLRGDRRPVLTGSATLRRPESPEDESSLTGVLVLTALPEGPPGTPVPQEIATATARVTIPGDRGMPSGTVVTTLWPDRCFDALAEPLQLPGASLADRFESRGGKARIEIRTPERDTDSGRSVLLESDLELRDVVYDGFHFAGLSGHALLTRKSVSVSDIQARIEGGSRIEDARVAVAFDPLGLTLGGTIHGDPSFVSIFIEHDSGKEIYTKIWESFEWPEGAAARVHVKNFAYGDGPLKEDWFVRADCAVETTGAVVRGVVTDSARFDVRLRLPRKVEVNDVDLSWQGQKLRGRVDIYTGDPLYCQFGVDGVCDPTVVVGALDPDWVDYLADFGFPDRSDVRCSGSLFLEGPPRLVLEGDYSLPSCSYRDFLFTDVNGTWGLTGADVNVNLSKAQLYDGDAALQVTYDTESDVGSLSFDARNVLVTPLLPNIQEYAPLWGRDLVFSDDSRIDCKGSITLQEGGAHRLEGTLRSSRCRYKSLTFEDVSADWAADGATVQCDVRQSLLYGGATTLSLDYDTTRRRGRLAGDVTGASFGELLAEFSSDPETARLAGGKLVAGFGVELLLGWPGAPLQLQGKGNVSLTEGDLWRVPLLDGLGTVLDLTKLSGLFRGRIGDLGRISSLDADLLFGGDTVTVPGFTTNGTIVSLEGSGTYHLPTEQVDFRVEGRTLRGLAMLTLPLRPLSWMFDARLTGTPKDPKWQPGIPAVRHILTGSGEGSTGGTEESPKP